MSSQLTSLATRQHTQRVRLLYRKMLKDSQDWCIQRHIWVQMAGTIRYRFESMKNETNAAVANRWLAATEAEFKKFQHPDPYCAPTQQGGSSFQRNAPDPIHLANQPLPVSPWMRKRNFVTEKDCPPEHYKIEPTKPVYGQ